VESPSLEVFKKHVDIAYFRTWFSRHGGVGFTAELNDLKGLSQP